MSLRNALPQRAEVEANALFVTSSFIAIYVFACPTVQRGGEPRSLTWFPVLRGIPALVHGNWSQIATALAPSLRNAPPCESRTSLPPLPQLWHLCEGVNDPAEKGLYLEATQMLEMAWNVHRKASEEFWVAAAFLWPVKVSDGFLRLLMEHRPRALVLLAHYGAMFSKLESFWWIGTRAREELEIIEKIVGEDWKRVWLSWVRDVVEGQASMQMGESTGGS